MENLPPPLELVFGVPCQHGTSVCCTAQPNAVLAQSLPFPGRSRRLKTLRPPDERFPHSDHITCTAFDKAIRFCSFCPCGRDFLQSLTRLSCSFLQTYHRCLQLHFNFYLKRERTSFSKGREQITSLLSLAAPLAHTTKDLTHCFYCSRSLTLSSCFDKTFGILYTATAAQDKIPVLQSTGCRRILGKYFPCCVTLQ